MYLNDNNAANNANNINSNTSANNNYRSHLQYANSFAYNNGNNSANQIQIDGIQQQQQSANPSHQMHNIDFLSIESAGMRAKPAHLINTPGSNSNSSVSSSAMEPQLLADIESVSANMFNSQAQYESLNGNSAANQRHNFNNNDTNHANHMDCPQRQHANTNNGNYHLQNQKSKPSFKMK